GTDDGAWATLSLDATPVTRAQYPWDFHASYTYRLRGASLAIEMLIENRGAAPMPFGAGFHPYFAVRDADKARVVIPTKATRAFDNAAKREIAFTGLTMGDSAPQTPRRSTRLPELRSGSLDLGAPEVDMHLYDHGSTEAFLTLDDLAVAIRGSAEFT